MTFNWMETLGLDAQAPKELRFTACSFLREGHYEKALTLFAALIYLDRGNPYDMQTLGALYLQLGRKEEALQTLDQALALDPLHEPTLLNKSKVLLFQGKKAEALPLLTELQKSAHPAVANSASALFLAYYQ